MSSLTLRTAKGSPLTNAEVDANFTNLLVAIGGTNSSPYTVPTPTGTGSPVLSDSPTFTGTVVAPDFNTTSDSSLKENVEPILDGLSIINKLKPVSFDWIESGQKAYGLIAQEVEEVLPEVVHTSESNIKSIGYSQLISFLIKSVQQQEFIIADLKERIQILENQ